MASSRSLEDKSYNNSSERKTPLQLFKNLDLDLIVLKDDIEFAKNLQLQDKTAMYTLGKYRTDLAEYKKELSKVHDSKVFEKVKYKYADRFNINTEVKYKNENSIVIGISSGLLFCGFLGLILDMKDQKNHLYLFGALCLVGILGIGLSRMMNSISHIYKKELLANQQFEKPINEILTAENKLYYQNESYRYLQTRIQFFKKNPEKINAAMRLYPAPYEVMRLMLDCYHAIKQSHHRITCDMTAMLDATFGYYFYSHEEPYHQDYKDLLTEYLNIRMDYAAISENERQIEKSRPRSLSA
ncbi:MAG: hypothetical protein ACYCQI_13095 [Gammaproteobacteria bacterium]